MYNSDPVTTFELKDNQWDGNPVTSSLSWYFMSINGYVINMEQFYHSMLSKGHKYQEGPYNTTEVL